MVSASINFLLFSAATSGKSIRFRVISSFQYFSVCSLIIESSSSKIEIEDLGWSNTPTIFDVSNIMQDFNLVFYAYPHIISHLTWLKETFQQ